jgi:hypothetical protein
MKTFRQLFEAVTRNEFFDEIFKDPSLANLSAASDWLQDQDDPLGKQMYNVLNGAEADVYIKDNSKLIPADLIHVIPYGSGIVHIMHEHSDYNIMHYLCFEQIRPLIGMVRTRFADNVLYYYGGTTNKRYGSDPMLINPQLTNFSFNIQTLMVAAHATDKQSYQNISLEIVNLLILGLCQITHRNKK